MLAPLGVRKILKSYLFKNKWTLPPTICFSIIVWCQEFLKINFVIFCQNYFLKICSRLNTLHQSSTLASISWCEISETTLIQGKTRELRLHFSTLQNVYDCLRNFGVSAPLAAAKGRRRPAAQQQLLFSKLARLLWGGPTFPHSLNNAQFLKLFALFLASLRNVTIIMSSPISANIFQFSMER